MIKIYCDGAYQLSTKKAGIGIHFYFDDEHVIYRKSFDNLHDNHEAEFLAVIHALEELNQRQVDKQQLIVIHTDSKIVASSLEKQFVKKQLYHNLLMQIIQLMQAYPLAFVKWIPEKENLGADALARQALRL
ncbi:ribonuclease HI family protein [Fundicoccus sp. Sow4_H7]|uniref:ribonuclease HI family protein n=1 Tax=Fundicoccus sp. Sow4_H7 TaxID=3438784 RepID=UPI003F905803